MYDYHKAREQADGQFEFVFEYHFDYDRLIANFTRRIERLRANGFEVHHPKLPDRATWDFFPSGVIVKCRR